MPVPAKPLSGSAREGPFTKDENDRLWLDPVKLDREYLNDFDILEWKGRYFELQGQRPSDGLWWVEEIASLVGVND
jgi:hypothetical protein